jgi:hypothetical protein
VPHEFVGKRAVGERRDERVRERRCDRLVVESVNL